MFYLCFGLYIFTELNILHNLENLESSNLLVVLPEGRLGKEMKYLGNCKKFVWKNV